MGVYMKADQARDANIVTGSYSYVDPLGSLITVTYEAGPAGYTEQRNVQENFVVIRAKAPRVAPAPRLAPIRPAPRPLLVPLPRPVAPPLPVVQSSGSLADLFGTG